MKRKVIVAGLRALEGISILGALVGVALQESPFLVSLAIVGASGLALYVAVKLEGILCAN